jgi:hypothetical protein
MALVQILIAIVMFFAALANGADPTDDPDCGTDGADGCIFIDSDLPDPETAAPGWEPVRVNGIDGVILPANAGEDFLIEATEFWKPDVALVEKAEFALEAEQGFLSHYRQYVGFEDEVDGTRKILINGFCDAGSTNWYRTPMIVMDGGDCYFNAEFDVETGEIDSFAFNGSV